MCDKCDWRKLVEVVGAAIESRPDGLDTRRQEWLEQISITVDDDRHATDRQKGVVRSILKQSKSKFVKQVPKPADRSRWSDDKKKRMREARRRGRDYDRYGRF